jgi:hypothetical protein
MARVRAVHIILKHLQEVATHDDRRQRVQQDTHQYRIAG